MPWRLLYQAVQARAKGSVTTRHIGKTRRFPTARDGDATWLLYSCALLLTTVP